MTHRGSRNQQAARGGVFPTQTKRAVGLGEPAGAGLPEKPGQKAAGPEPGTLPPDAAAWPPSHPPRRCLAASPLGSGAKHAGDTGCGRAGDAPAAPPPWPGGPQPGLQHLPVDPHPKPRAQGQGGPAGGRGPLGWAPPGPLPSPVPLLAVLVSVLEEEGRDGEKEREGKKGREERRKRESDRETQREMSVFDNLTIDGQQQARGDL